MIRCRSRSAWRARHGCTLAAAGTLAAAAAAAGFAATAGQATAAGPATATARAATRTQAAATAAATATAATTATATATATATWQLRLAIQYLPPATNHSQYLVTLVEPDGTWLLGGSDVGGHGVPEAERVRNGIPQSVPIPSGPHSWIAAASATSADDIWAVTYLGGSVLHWDGSAWATEPRGGWAAGTRFTSVVAISPADVWLFGDSGRRYLGAGTWHLSGTTWTQVKGAASYIFQASEASPTDLWGIGGARALGDPNHALLHFTGSSWQRVSPAALAGFSFSSVLAVGPDDVWVAGSAAGGPELGHFDGRSWTAVSMPGTVAATAICRDGSGGIWAVANAGTSPSVMRDRSASGTWTRAVVSSDPADEVLSCALVPDTTRVWGAGKSTAPHGSAAAGYRYG